MPVIGEPISFPLTLLIPRPNVTVRQAVAKISEHFPRPYNFTSSFGFNLRKRRLGVELAEFDFLHRLRRGQPANLDRLISAGMLLIDSCKGAFPTRTLPLDEQLLINSETLSALLAQIEDMLDELGLD